MHEGDDGSALKEAPAADSGRELSKASGADSQTSADGVAPTSKVSMTALRFGFFEPASAPPRLWSERVESDEVFEHTLPALDFEDVVSPVLGALPTLVRGEEEESRQVATPSHAQHVDFPQDVVPVVEVLPSGGGPGQVASAPSSPLARPELQAAVPLSGGGSGQVASGPSSPAAPRVAGPTVASVSPSSQRAGVDGELGQVAHAPPSTGLEPSLYRGALPTSAVPLSAPPLSVQLDRRWRLTGCLFRVRQEGPPRAGSLGRR